MKHLWVVMLVCLTASRVYAQSGPAVSLVEEGQGYQRVRINDPQYTKIFKAQVRSAVKSGAVPAKLARPSRANTTSDTREAVVIKTLRGLQLAHLPAWVEADILADAGYHTWAGLTDAQLDAPIDTTSIDVDALSIVEQMLHASGPSSPTPHSPVAPLGWWRAEWEDKSRSIVRDIDTNQPVLAQHDAGGVLASLNGVFQGHGVFKMDMSYGLKKRFGIPYRARFNAAEVTIDATLGGQFGVTGSARYQLHQELLRQSLTLWAAHYDWWVYIFQFQLELALALDLGVTLDVEASATFESLYNAGGVVGLTWNCTSHGCTRTRNNVNLDFAVNDTHKYAVHVKVQVTPFADITFAADLDMYWDAIQIAKAKVGVVAAVPVTYYGYKGNLCSDADNDGENEVVEASVLDITGELYAYFTVELLNQRAVYPIDLSLGGWHKKKTITLYTEKDFHATVYSKNLLYKDLLTGGSSVVEPVLVIPDIVSQAGGLTVAPRSCYPFEEDVLYEVNWGDGSVPYLGGGGLVPHTWPAYGEYAVTVRMVTDDADRAFTERWVSKTVNVSPDGQTPFYPWLIPVLAMLR